MSDHDQKPASPIAITIEIPQGVSPEIQLLAAFEKAAEILIPGATAEAKRSRCRAARWNYERNNEYSTTAP